MLKASASSVFRAAQAPNSAESTAVQRTIMLVPIHDGCRGEVCVGCPSSEGVSLFESNPSQSSVFTGLYDSSRFFVLMPNMSKWCETKQQRKFRVSDSSACRVTRRLRYDCCKMIYFGTHAMLSTTSPRQVSLKLHTMAVFQSYPAKADRKSIR